MEGTETTSSPNLPVEAILQRLATEFPHQPQQIRNTLTLLLGDNTIPFVARYRKEQTGNLDEVQIGDLYDRYEYLKELEERRETILGSITEQEKLTPELDQRIKAATTKQELEDLYLPYKPKRRTRAMIAKEKGLQPLAELAFEAEATRARAEEWIAQFNAAQAEPLTNEDVWQGVRDIWAEQVAEDADTRAAIRELTSARGTFVTEAKPEWQEKQSKFEMYYNFSEPVSKIQAHRYLAIRRGEKENILRVRIDVPEEPVIAFLQERWLERVSPDFRGELQTAMQDAYERLLAPAIENDLRTDLKQRADGTSIELFSKNLSQLLMQPPGGAQTVIGLDPAFRTGTKWVVIDETGRLLENGVIYPVEPQNKVEESRAQLQRLIDAHNVDIIAIGNGTASREVSQFVKAFIKETESDVRHLVVNESGASVYSASEVARQEFPDLDLTIRGAVSIARRYQDPLAELVKIDPKSIGVGQYQHDVNQKQLKQSLDRTVESCVNLVGVELNQASSSLLGYVSGVTKALAKRIVEHRNENGAFKSREDLMQVSGFGKKTYEQAAGFLRIRDGANPLDASAVHPERYEAVANMAAAQGLEVAQLIGNTEAVSRINISDYESEELGRYTLQDILAELQKPGRDPREDHKNVQFNDQIEDIADLKPGMKLNGVVTNVTNFGAFVDVGVHQDGLVHISQMSQNFVKDPLEACTVGQPVQVWVLDVDAKRKRISLSLRSPEAGRSGGKSKANQKKSSGKRKPAQQKPVANVTLDQLMDKFNS